MRPETRPLFGEDDYDLDPITLLDGHPSVWSDCRTYRYVLWRTWGKGDIIRYVQFVGLNPSTADDFTPDNTLTRCVNFAKRWGYDAMCMTNLFAFRTKSPRVMKAARDPVGPDNDRWLQTIALEAQEVVGCWGTDGSHLGRAVEVYKLIPELKCLGCNADGSPRHPLYLPNNTPLEAWSTP